ncbi:MAG: DUF3574 domain-containing protein [Acidobacteriota bacterium]
MKRNFITTLVLIILFSVSSTAFASDPQGSPFEHPAIAGKSGNAKQFAKCLIRSERFFSPTQSSSPEETKKSDKNKDKFKGDSFARTELYFGSAKPDGSVVTPEQFQQFLDQVITPRFPDGLTLLVGLGQFRDSTGTIIKERSMLLILLYPTSAKNQSSEKIEEIREAYKQAFQQESVLRSDSCCEKVGF